MTWKDPEYLAFSTAFCRMQGQSSLKIHKTKTSPNKPE